MRELFGLNEQKMDKMAELSIYCASRIYSIAQMDKNNAKVDNNIAKISEQMNKNSEQMNKNINEKN